MAPHRQWCDKAEDDDPLVAHASNSVIGSIMCPLGESTMSYSLDPAGAWILYAPGPSKCKRLSMESISARFSRSDFCPYSAGIGEFGTTGAVYVPVSPDARLIGTIALS
jgi:hypothetical protein